MNARVNREGRGVHRLVALHYLARFVDEHQVGRANPAEMRPERVDPETGWILGVARRNVSGYALVEAEAGKQAKRRRQPLFAVPAFFREGGEHRRGREILWPPRSVPH